MVTIGLPISTGKQSSKTKTIKVKNNTFLLKANKELF